MDVKYFTPIFICTLQQVFYNIFGVYNNVILFLSIVINLSSFKFFNSRNVEVVRVGKARRAKLYYLRDRVGKAAKTREKIGARIATEEISVKAEDATSTETTEEVAQEETSTEATTTESTATANEVNTTTEKK